MKKKIKGCEPEKLSRYFDGELEADEKSGLLAHLEECSPCRKVLEDFEHLSHVFSRAVDRAGAGFDGALAEKRALEKIQTARESPWQRVVDLRAVPRLVIPVAAVVVLLIGVFSFMGGPEPRTGPSAIINSFTGEVSSVMILETPRSHQTVIWFHET